MALPIYNKISEHICKLSPLIWLEGKETNTAKEANSHQCSSIINYDP